MIRFDGRVVVITGAARGLGAAYAALLRSRGATVVVNDVEPPGDRDDDVDDTNDVSSVEGAVALIDGVVAAHGRVDAVVANAGIMRWAGVEDAELSEHWAVHVGGSFNVVQAAWPHLRDAGAGRVVLTTSTGLLGLPDNVAYATAKGGVIGLMRALAFAGRRHRIGVNGIAPAASTRLAGDGGRDLPPALAAPMVAYLAHESCPATGEIYAAGGGRFARLFIGSTPGWVGDGADPTPEDVASNWDAINDESGYTVPADLVTWSAQFLGHLGC